MASLRSALTSPRLPMVLGALAVVSLFFAGTLWLLNTFFPMDSTARDRPRSPRWRTCRVLPPLQPITRASYVIAPVAVSLSAIGRSLDAAAPRDLSGKNSNPVSSLLSQANIGITVTRGAMSVSGKPNELTVTTPLNGVLQITGQIAGVAGGVVGGITGLLNSAARQGPRQAHQPGARPEGRSARPGDRALAARDHRQLAAAAEPHVAAFAQQQRPCRSPASSSTSAARQSR